MVDVAPFAGVIVSGPTDDPKLGAKLAPGIGEVRPELGFDQILSLLRDTVMQLESGELSLEESLRVYEEGVQLARRGQQLLASAEKRIEILVSASGGVEVVPFDLSSSSSSSSGTGQG